jgi:DNA-directed RNA polymerase specialized sigma24 family protein
MAHEQAEALEQALAGLPKDYRQVILLRYQEEHTFEEIGRLMNRSADAARKLWLRAVERLQQEMDKPAKQFGKLGTGMHREPGTGTGLEAGLR